MIDFAKSFYTFVRPHRVVVVILFIGLCLESLYDVAIRFSLKFVIDSAVVEQDITALVTILSILAVGALFFNALVIGCDYLWARVGGQIINNMRMALFRHMQNLPVDYYKRRSTGDLTARFNADAGLIETGIILGVPMAVMGLVEVVASLAIMAWLHPVLFFIALFGITLSLLAPRLVHGRALDATFALRREEGRMAGFLQENISAHGMVKAYALEGHTSKLFGSQLDVLLKKLARANFLNYLVSRLPSLTFLLLQLVVLGVGGWLAIQGEITVGALVSYQALLIGLNTAIFNLTWMIPTFIDAAAGYRRVEEIFEERPSIVDEANATILPPLSQGITFDGVRFGYAGDQAPLFEDLSFRVNKGEFVSFVGPSGAGKSSILNLVLRFYDPSAGRIAYDGHDLRTVTQASLREQIALVSQDVMLFDVSVRDNIRLGALDASEEDVERAARAAEIHDPIMALPEGYDTPVGQGGSRLSGGERQRIALARALLRKPAILILDEVSSALDAATEAEILETIKALKGSCTILCVTHRLAMAEASDRILVVKGGRVAEQGHHRELLTLGAEYAKLWAASRGERL